MGLWSNAGLAPHPAAAPLLCRTEAATHRAASTVGMLLPIVAEQEALRLGQGCSTVGGLDHAGSCVPSAHTLPFTTSKGDLGEGMRKYRGCAFQGKFLCLPRVSETQPVIQYIYKC